MTKIIRIVILATVLVSSLGALASSAGATTWSNDGDASFVATSTPSTLSLPGVGLSCTTWHVTATVTGAVTIPRWLFAHGTFSLTFCFAAGVSSPTHCAYTLTATSGVVGGVTTGALDMTCSVYQFNTKVCDISGSVNATYTNPTATASGRIATTTGGSLVTGTGCAAALGGAGKAGHLSPVTFTVVGGATKGPIITHV